ncbi:MAG: DUF748 domain-containing protein [Zoogloeaceae bacterium]|nr:DUF748 domain-containing protein [Zoogloeaceae bacterium]
MTEHDTAGVSPAEISATETSSAAAGRRSRLACWGRRLAWTVAALLALWCLLWLAAPPLIKWQGQKIGTETLGRPVSIGAVEFTPWSLELTLRELSIGGAQPADPPQLAVKRLYVNVALESVWRLAPIVKAIQVDEPALRLRHLGDGHYDADDVITRLTSGPKNEKPMRFALYDIAVQDGRATFIDDPVQRTHEVRDLQLTLPFISNLPSQLKSRVTPRLALTLNGSRFDSGAQTLPFDPSRHTEAHFLLQGFDLAPYLVYQPASLPLHVTAGALDADLRLIFEELPQPSLKIAGTASLSGIKANDAAGEEALAFERLAVDVSDIRPLEQIVHLASVELTAPRLLARRDAKGRINWVPAPAAAAPEKTAAAPAAATATTATTTTAADDANSKPAADSATDAATDSATDSAAADPAADGWRVSVDRIGIAQGDLRWRDQQPASGAVEVALSQLQLDARDFVLNGEKPIPLELSALLAPKRGEPGKLAWRGTVSLAPISAEGEVDAERLPLQAFKPYVAEQLNIDILRADASFKGKVDFALQNNGPRLRLAGDARIEELRTTTRPTAGDAAPDKANAAAKANEAKAARPARAASGKAKNSAAVASKAAAQSSAALAPSGAGGIGEELLSWKQLRVAGLNVQLDPNKAPQVTVKDSRLSDFYARIIIDPAGRINLQNLVKTDPSAPASASTTTPAPAPTPTASAPVMRFGPTRLVNGRVSFSDHFIQPNYSADLSKLNGSLSAFDSVTNPQAPRMADLQLTGRAEGTAQLAVKGKLNPLAQPLALDIAAKITDLELPPLSPYSVKYAGHGIERGKLSMDVAYKITPGGQLTASNKLVLNQLQFGDAVPGAPASLPVRLATALLSDSNGVIDLDLPISGSINDPEFSIGPIIFKAIVNLIGKAITAPFTLLARLFSDGGEDMSHVAFAAGSAALSDAAKAQLDKIAKAMTDRPQLKLTVTGAARLDEEREGFKRERLQALVAAERRAGSKADAETDDAAPATEETAAAANASSSPDTAAAPTDADYPQLLRRLYRRADIPDKPRNLVGMSKDVPVAQMESLLLAHINVSEDDIRQLAIQRAVAVKDYLLAQHLNADRVFVGAGKAADTPPPASTPASTPTPPAPAGDTAPTPPTTWTPNATLELGAR